ncbi:HlyD family efflux transporter periplasmic adaptor subunit [Sinimarinibacterium sp. CAU 1509]|uniref:HlyD family secretion protein n=1 Tax=Sinimarinibacterium sp. CAU 1509 TaxID=2562283 RepID=UPI0010AC4D74|nr:HlyD family efflux transporter periplasmic adaptor subunit [Sinimarinibacterium sp. CAU 1509]TJY62125.1 HlyD family efflux transporter periplasmic adaptor subunit [Sinimarinibacterium sp. CAU 1509]
MSSDSKRSQSQVLMSIISLVMTAIAVSACSADVSPSVQGYVEGESLRMGPGRAGRLDAIDVTRGTEVAAGQRLFAVDAASEQAALQQAEANLSAAKARLQDLSKGKRESEVATIREQLAQATAQLQLSTLQLRRIETLFQRDAVSADERDQARAQKERDGARVRELQATILTAELAGREDALQAAADEVRVAAAAVEQAQWNLDQKSVSAPAAGVIEDVYYRVGEWVGAGAPVVAVLPPQNRILRFFVDERRLGALKIGQQVKVHCDGCGDAVTATIQFIASSAEFTPPVIYSREQRARLVFRVEATPTADAATRLHPGQPVDIELGV